MTDKNTFDLVYILLKMPPNKCDKSLTLLSKEKDEILEENKNNNDNGQNISSFWTRVPGMGLICIIIKNLLGGVSDSVAKKIENIGKFLLYSNKL